MPQFGTLDVAARAARAPHVAKLADEPWESGGAEVLNLVYEFDDTRHLELIPPALHPSIPLYGTITVSHFPESPIGDFRLAEARIMTRAGIHYGGFVTGAIASRERAAEFLQGTYGTPARAGEVRLERRHYGTETRVRVDGETALEATLEHPEPISSTDLMSTASFHLAHVDGELVLVQVEPHGAPELVDRGRPRVRVFDGAAFGEPRLKLTNPLPATFTRGKAGYEAVRYLIDPTKPARQGTRER